MTDIERLQRLLYGHPRDYPTLTGAAWLYWRIEPPTPPLACARCGRGCVEGWLSGWATVVCLTCLTAG